MSESRAIARLTAAASARDRDYLECGQSLSVAVAGIDSRQGLNAVGSAISSSVGDGVRLAIGTALGATVGVGVGISVGGRVGASLGGAGVGTAVRSLQAAAGVTRHLQAIFAIN